MYEDPLPTQTRDSSHRLFKMSRYYAPGRNLAEVYRASRTRPVRLNREVLAEHTDSFEQYTLGCSVHEQCRGSFVKTAKGATLMPSGFVVVQGMFSNAFAKHAKEAFSAYERNPNDVYLEGLKNEMLTKHGYLRSMNSGMVEGSARLVLSPCWTINEDEVAISQHSCT